MKDMTIKAVDINAVLLTVRAINKEDGDMQLAILTMALVVACRSCGVDKFNALTRIRQAFNIDIKIEPLAEAVTIQ